MFVNQPDDAQLVALWHDPRDVPRHRPPPRREPDVG